MASKAPEDKSTPPGVEKYITLHEAADIFGLPYFKILRAAKQKVIPTYTIFNSRRLVRASEVEAIIVASREGGV
jgi:hypothetical protein